MRATAQDQDTNDEATSQAGGLVSLVPDTLFALTERPQGSSIRAIAQATNNSRSSTHRILQTLAKAGYAQQTDNGGYVVGSKLLLLAARVFGAVPVLELAHSIMRNLVDEIGETCYLATYSPADDFITYVHRIESDHLVRFVQPLGVKLPLHAGAVGKAILAALPKVDFSSLDMVAYTARTLTSVKELQANLSVAKKHGYATSIEERVIGVAGVAAVVRSGDKVIGALTVSVPLSRIPAKGLDILGVAVRKHADELSSALTSMGVERI
nr:IclR family transcriptional regulator [Microvirga zambiensis]